MIYACDEHVDIALEMIVDRYETAPTLEPIQEEKKISTTCEFCQKQAAYIVAN